MDFTKIPNELKEVPQWVCTWDTSKIPMQAVRRKAASASDPSTWCDFASAKNAVESGMYDNVGFVFNNNGIIGIDVDAGFEDKILTPLAVDLINVCQSYTEKSRSGRGIHILIKGDIPFKGRNNGNGVEIYKVSRYFIMTGNTLIYDKIEYNQNAIDYILEKYFSPYRESTNTNKTSQNYVTYYPKPENNKIKISKIYPKIENGSRNMSLTSLAGQLYTQGYPLDVIFNELLKCNIQACVPPLSRSEVGGIAKSISRYRR